MIEVNYALSTLHSYARPGQDDNPNSYLKKELDNQIMKQEEILKDDDILDEDTDSDDMESLEIKQPMMSPSASGTVLQSSQKLSFKKMDANYKSSSDEVIFID